MFIYKITNRVNGKIYVGKTTKGLPERLYEHWRSAKWKKNKTIIAKAILKYGRDQFLIEQLDRAVTIIELNEKERYWISCLKPEYNITEGGSGGDTSNSDNFKKAISKRNMKGPNNPMFGRRGIQNPKFGSKMTDQQKQNVRDGVLKNWANNPERKEKARQRMVAMNKKRYNGN